VKHDEFSFLNLQLAGMLRDGVPLEGALRQVVQTMHRGSLRNELEKIEADLESGVPLGQALENRKLPPFYVRMVQVGASGGDLPGVLTLLADYYQRSNVLWTRLKGLMVYPVILFGMSFVLSAWLAFLFVQPSASIFGIYSEVYSGFGAALPGPSIESKKFIYLFSAIAPPVVFGLVFAMLVVCLVWPRLRRWICWRTPAFRDASLAQFAAAMHVLLKGGGTLGEAIALMASLEEGTPAGRDAAGWVKRCREGHARFSDVASGSRVFPPLFVWLVSSGGGDLAAGFHRAAEVYDARSAARSELLLYSALPASLVFIGAMVAAQIYPLAILYPSMLEPMYKWKAIIGPSQRVKINTPPRNAPAALPQPVPNSASPPEKR
jgi:type II secretory pathway component PulF